MLKLTRHMEGLGPQIHPETKCHERLKKQVGKFRSENVLHFP